MARTIHKITIFLLFLAFLSCEKITETQSVGYEYYPLKLGYSWVYEINEEKYILGEEEPLQRTYHLNERIVDVFKDAKGNEIFKLERYKKNLPTQNWQLDSVWTTQLLPDKAIRVENNAPLIKLIFPIAEKTKWNVNTLNTSENDEYTYENVGKNYKTTQKYYENTLTVAQQKDSSLVSVDKRFEVYAKNVGLVYKESTNLFYCQSTPACIGKGIIDYGIRRKQLLIENQ